MFSRSKRWMRSAVLVSTFAVTGFAVWIGAMAAGRVRAPYSEPAKALAWLGGFEENAYNFGIVVPGRLYRSGRPDARFLRRLRDHYGIERVLSLNGDNEFHAAAKQLGIEVTALDWSSNRLPPPEELDRALGLMDEPAALLVHCSAGSDRSGYAIAEYRMRRQGWTPTQAFAEMNDYWHKPYRKPWFQAAMLREHAASPPRPLSVPLSVPAGG